MKKLFARIKAAGFGWFHFLLLFNAITGLVLGSLFEFVPWLASLIVYDMWRREQRECEHYRLLAKLVAEHARHPNIYGSSCTCRSHQKDQ